jgi:hypothetical protein
VANRRTPTRQAGTCRRYLLAIAVLLLVATLVHRERFHDDLFGWFWLVTYVVVPPVLGLAVAGELRAARRAGAAARPAPGRRCRRRCAACSRCTALVLVPVSVSLALGRGEPWPWPLTPLTSMALGAFVVGFGVAAAHSAWSNDLARFQGAAVAYAALGALELVALSIFGDALDAGAAGVAAYAAFLARAVVAGLAGLAAYPTS